MPRHIHNHNVIFVAVQKFAGVKKRFLESTESVNEKDSGAIRWLVATFDVWEIVNWVAWFDAFGIEVSSTTLQAIITKMKILVLYNVMY